MKEFIQKLTRYQFDWCEMCVLGSRGIYINIYVLIWKQTLAHLHIWLKNIFINLLKDVNLIKKQRKRYMIGQNDKIVWTATYSNFQHSVLLKPF